MAASRGNVAVVDLPSAERRTRRGRPTNAERGLGTDRRQSILDAATRRFAEFGFQATTVRQIADDVALGSGSLFHHFATKEEMLVEIVRPTVRRLSDGAHRISSLPLDAETRLVALIGFNLAEVTANRAVHTILDHERKLFRRGGDFADVLEARKAAYLAWDRILHDGIGEGLFLEDLDRFLAISTIVRMLSSAADWHRAEDAPFPATYDVAGLSRFYAGFVLRAIRRPERTGLPVPEQPMPGAGGGASP